MLAVSRAGVLRLDILLLSECATPHFSSYSGVQRLLGLHLMRSVGRRPADQSSRCRPCQPAYTLAASILCRPHATRRSEPGRACAQRSLRTWRFVGFNTAATPDRAAARNPGAIWLEAAQTSLVAVVAALSVVVNGCPAEASLSQSSPQPAQPAERQQIRRLAKLDETIGLLKELFVDARASPVQWHQLYKLASAELGAGVDADTAISHMLDRLGDHWTRLVPPQDTPRLQMDTTGQVVHVGLRLEPQSDGPLHVTYVAPGSAAEREGVQPGDQVLAINGQPALSLDRGQLSRMLRQECTLQLRRVAQALSSEPLELQVDLFAEPISVRHVFSTFLPSSSAPMGYIHIKAFGHSTAASTEQAFRQLQAQGASGFILDLRGNPGGLVQAGYQIASLLLNPGDTFCHITNLRGPEHAQAVPSGGRPIVAGPVVVMVNGGTASTSEVLAAALQGQRRAVLLGEHTYGKGRTQRMLPLQDGSTLLVSNALLTSPLHATIDKVGLEPDVACKLDNDDFQAWMDDTTSTMSLQNDNCIRLAMQQFSDSGKAALLTALSPAPSLLP